LGVSEKRQAVQAANWSDQVVTDGRLVTGQNPQSAASVGRAIVEELATRA
jgi:putative intracellular protease/amidase